MQSDLVLLTGNANPLLASKIAEHLDTTLGDTLVSSFSDGETRVQINTNVRGRDVFIIQPTSFPANQHLMEVLIMADACKRASAGRITLVVPYFGYARQERKEYSRSPITAKLVANMIQAAGFDRVVSMELHAGAIQGFFDIPVDHLYSKKIFASHFQELHKDTHETIIVSPDAGGVARARALAKELDCGLAIIDKRRNNPNESEVMNVLGDIKDKQCLIFDDMCDTGGSLVKASDALYANGAISVAAAITHSVLSGEAKKRIADSSIIRYYTTDTIAFDQNDDNLILTPNTSFSKKVRILSTANLLAKAIKRIHNNESVSSLF